MNRDPETHADDEASEPSGEARVSGRQADAPDAAGATAPREIGGRGGLDPVRYGDWEKDGRCIDF
jgi:hypothetical protein